MNTAIIIMLALAFTFVGAPLLSGITQKMYGVDQSGYFKHLFRGLGIALSFVVLYFSLAFLTGVVYGVFVLATGGQL